MLDKSRLMPISYYNPKQEIRLSAYADTIILEPDGREQRLRAIRFGGYPEMVRAMSDAIYAGATLETEFAGEPAMLACEPKKYECHLSHDGIYAEATILSLDDADTAAKKDEDAQADGQTNVELPPRKCILFCPAGDRQALFEALDRKTAVPLIPEFQDYVLDELRRRGILRPLRVISIRERLEAWLLLCKKDDANIVKVLEDGLKASAIRIPGTLQDPHGFDSVHSVTSYLSAFGVTVAERIREQFQPLFDPAAEQLSPEILRINDYIRKHAGYSLYPAQLAVAESVKRKLSEGKSAFIVAECGSGKTKIGATALAVYQAQKRKKTFNIILCPSHVAKKWVREIAETLPDTAGVIVRSITELDSLYAQYRQGDKSIYAVISKEKARDGYMRRPAVLFDARKGVFRCPGCGSVIELPSSDDTYDWVTAKPEAFRMENRRNHQCMNCESPLWTAVNPSVPSPWVKIPEYGWVHRKLAVHAIQKTKNPAALDALLSLHENPDGYFPTRGACRRYPLSSYIKKRYRGRLDGLIVDELHEYNNDSGQGDAMAELFGTAKKVIGMTATLINGYSSGIFHLLYRTSAQLMLTDGKPHERPALFNTEYEGEKGCLYISASVYNDHQAPAISYTYAVPKYSPAFCVKSDGTATIRWFSSQNKMQNAINACDCIIAGAHAIVFDGKCTTDENVYDNETGTDNHKLIYNTNGDQSATRWDASVVSSATADETAKRCCFGHKAGSDGVYIMVCTDSYASLHEMANLMKLLGCDYAVNLDGNGSVQMRIKDGYGASGKVTSASGNLIYAGIAAYLV